MRRLLLLLAAALLAFAAAACGSSPSATSTTGVGGVLATPTGASGASAPASPTETTATDTGPLSSLALPSFDLHGAPDLEATLPATIGGQAVQRYSFSLAQMGALGQNAATDQTFTNWIHALGKNPSDVTMAVGYTTGQPSLTEGAMKVNGADQNQLMTSFALASQQSNMTVTQVTVGGKQVVKIVNPESAADTTYAYAKGDTLYFATAPDDTSAATVLQGLP